MIIKVQYYSEDQPPLEIIHECASYQVQHVNKRDHPEYMKKIISGEIGFSYHPERAVPESELASLEECTLLRLPEINYQQIPDRAPILIRKCTLWVMNSKGDTIDKVVCG